MKFTFKLPRPMRNGYNIGHGGALASLLDDATWAAVYSFTGKYPFSVKLVMEYMNQVPIEKDLTLELRVNKLSKNVVFVDAMVYDGETGMLLCKASNILA